MSMNVTRALELLDSIELPESTAGLVRSRGEAPAEAVAGKQQAFFTGSDIVTYAAGVDAQTRQDIYNSMLLAQLAANKQVTDTSNLSRWYDAYFNVLAATGWVIQQRDFREHNQLEEGAEAHEAILQVATTLLGPNPTTLALVTSVIGALKEMEKDDPWLTLFNRESASNTTAHFQVAIVDKSGKDDVSLTSMAFSLEASQKVTQVLFFKFRNAEMTLKQCSGQVSLNREIMDSSRQLVRDKLAARTLEYIGELHI